MAEGAAWQKKLGRDWRAVGLGSVSQVLRLEGAAGVMAAKDDSTV